MRKVFFMNVHSLLDKVIHTLAGIGIFSVFIFSCLSIAINIASPHTYHVTDLLDNWVDENGNSFSLNSFHTDSISDPQTQSVMHIASGNCKHGHCSICASLSIWV